MELLAIQLNSGQCISEKTEIDEDDMVFHLLD